MVGYPRVCERSPEVTWSMVVEFMDRHGHATPWHEKEKKR